MSESRKLIIFDLDGTLVDSLRDITTAVNRARECAGMGPVTLERVRRAVGDGVGRLLQRVLLADDPRVTLSDAMRWFGPAYEACLLDTTRPYNGIAETLRTLRRSGWTLTVLSNKETRLARAVVGGIPSFDGLFDVVYGGDAFEERKPSPVGVRAVMAEFGGEAGHTIMVGDSCNDILAGKGAGCTTVAVSYGFTDGGTLLACHPDHLVADPMALIGVVEGVEATRR